MQVQTEQVRERIEGLRVIVVDDIIDSRDLLEMYLREKKAEVKAVGSARDALKTLENFQAQLIISDIYMPKEDGYWLIEQLKMIDRELEMSIPAIAVTAAAKQEDRERLISAGYDGYLAKPFLFEDLTRLINQIVSKKSSIMQN